MCTCIIYAKESLPYTKGYKTSKLFVYLLVHSGSLDPFLKCLLRNKTSGARVLI